MVFSAFWKMDDQSFNNFPVRREMCRMLPEIDKNRWLRLALR